MKGDVQDNGKHIGRMRRGKLRTLFTQNFHPRSASHSNQLHMYTNQKFAVDFIKISFN